MKRTATLGLAFALTCLCGTPAAAQEAPRSSIAAEQAADEEALRATVEQAERDKVRFAIELARQDLARAEALEAQANWMMAQAKALATAGPTSNADSEAMQFKAQEMLREAARIRAGAEGVLKKHAQPAIAVPFHVADPETARMLAELQGMAGRGAAQRPRVVLVPAGEMDAERAGSLAEDLAIMSRVLDKALAQALGEEHVPPTIHAVFGDQTKRTLYLDGYGAVFMLSVRFPLVGPGQAELREPEREPESLWEQTRREMRGGPPARRLQPGGQPHEGPAFSPERVERLIDVLLDSVGEAGHIRGLGPEDAIAVVVTSPGALRGAAGVLTVHVTKRDIDGLAEGGLPPEELRKRATIAIR